MEYLKTIFEEDGEIVKWRVYSVNENTALVEFELKRNLEPADLKSIEPPDPVKLKIGSKVVIISGRGPIWFYSWLTHKYHITQALAIFDPRFNGAVVVSSHTPRYKEGEIIPLG